MAPTDSHRGGDLYDMAAKGTSIPDDAGKMNIIPSKAQAGDGEGDATTLADAASNATDIPRTVRDTGATGEVETGTGDQLPAQVESKRLHDGPNNPASKGHDRSEKHGKSKGSDIERKATGGSGVDLQPSEDGIAGKENFPDEEVNRIVNDRERKQT